MKQWNCTMLLPKNRGKRLINASMMERLMSLETSVLPTPGLESVTMKTLLQLSKKLSRFCKASEDEKVIRRKGRSRW